MSSSSSWPRPPHRVALYSPPTLRPRRAAARVGAVTTTAAELPSRNLTHTVSGVSSGGGAAANHFVAFSRHVAGVGIIAGNPYGCGAPGVLLDPAKSCSYNVPPISIELLWAYVILRARQLTTGSDRLACAAHTNSVSATRFVPLTPHSHAGTLRDARRRV